MKQNSFWGTARSRGVNAGLIVRLSLAIMALVGSVTLAWTLLNARGAHAASVNTVNTLDNPWNIVFDGSGNAWVAEPNCNPAPQCSAPPNGAIQEFKLTGGIPTLINTYAAPSIPTTNHYNPTFIQLDGAGYVWFTDPTNNAIGRLTIAGNVWQEFPTPTANSAPVGLILDKHGNLWFTERNANKIGFYNTTTSSFVETAVATANSQPYGLAYDSAADIIWFDEDAASKIGKFTVSLTGTISPLEITVNNIPHLIYRDTSGNLWFSEQGADTIGKYNPTTQTTTVFSVAGSICPTAGVTPTTCTNTFIGGITVDSNGIVWFDETQTGQIGSLNPATKAVTLFNLGIGTGPGDGLNVDPNNNVWVSMQFSKQLGELPAGTLPSPTPSVGSGSPSPTTTSTAIVTPSPTPTLQAGPVNKTWYFAEGRVGGGFNEYLSMDNPTSNACAVKITYLYTPDSGTAQVKTVSINIPANTRYEEGVPGDLGTSPGGRGITNSAIVAVDNTITPLCAGIVAERPMYFNALGTNSGSDVLGVTRLASTFYIADVAVGAQNGGYYSSFITILNPPTSAGSAVVTAKYYANSATAGSPGTLIGTDQVTVPVGTRGTIFPNAHTTPTVLPAHVSVVVTSTQPVAVERPTYFSKVTEGNAGTVSGGADVIGVQALSNDWLFAEGYTGGQFQEQFVIANLDTGANAPASVTIKLEPQNGGAPSTFTLTVPTLSQTIWNVNTLSLLPGQSLSAEISSTGAKIVVEREMFFRYLHNANGRSLSASGGSDVLGQNGPVAATNYSFAEGYVNLGYDEWLTLQNPTASAETIWITLYNAMGRTYTTSVSVPAFSRATEDITGMVIRNLYRNGDGFKGYEVSMTVQTTATQGGPFVAERPMYLNVGSIQGGTDIIGYTGG